jgi:hypothetical protein
VFNVDTQQKEDHEQPDLHEIFTKTEEGECYLDEEKLPE